MRRQEILPTCEAILYTEHEIALASRSAVIAHAQGDGTAQVSQSCLGGAPEPAGRFGRIGHFAARSTPLASNNPQMSRHTRR
jgi:hypothetical protein